MLRMRGAAVALIILILSAIALKSPVVLLSAYILMGLATVFIIGGIIFSITRNFHLVTIPNSGIESGKTTVTAEVIPDYPARPLPPARPALPAAEPPARPATAPQSPDRH